MKKTNISFSETTEQVRDHRKYCTRRMDGSGRLAKKKPGDVLQGIERAQGLKKGETVKKLSKIIILEVNREPLKDIIRRPVRIIPPRVHSQYPSFLPSECTIEGFPQLTPVQFVDLFCRINKKCTPETEITRVLFDYRSES